MRYVFVGGFTSQAKDGSTGGQVFATRSLVASGLSDHIDWVPIDSTSETSDARSFSDRALPASLRLLRFLRAVCDPSVQGVLIFSSSGLSFIEKGLMAMTARALGKRVVLAPRSGLLIDDVERSRVMRAYVRLVLRRCDVVLCQGTTWKQYFQELTDLRDERLVVMPNWIDARASHLERAFDGRPTQFLYLGRIESYKGIFDLIDAVDSAKERLVDVRFVICGSGSAEGEARRRVEALGLADRYQFRGWQHEAEKAEALGSSHVLVLPSHREGMPNAVLEAMAAGVAVVATDVGGVADVLVRPELGWRVPPHDPVALAAALVEAHENKSAREAAAEAGRRHVLEHHAVDTIWPRLLHVLCPSAPADRDIP